jgi:hypothetical protein
VFKNAVKALFTRRAEDDEPQQQPRRRSGETDKALGRHDLRAYRAAERGQPRRRYDGLKAAKLRPAKAEPKAAPKVVAPADANGSAFLSLSDTLDWQALWQANANIEQWHDDDFSAKQDQYFPQP